MLILAQIPSATFGGIALATRVVLVRHGQSSFNAAGRIQGRSDSSVLTELGEAAALQTGEALSNLEFDAVYSSPLRRAKRTAELIHAKLATPPALQVSDSLLEINLSEWENLTRQEVQTQYPEAYACWKQRPHELQLGDRRPVLDLFEQARGFWQETLPRHAGKSILIVAHNGILRSLLSTALGIEASHYQVIRQSNCGISVLNFSGGFGEPVQLESLNQTAHLGEPIPDRGQSSGCRLLLVRHGETEWNRKQRFQGQIDIPLNETGRAQAQAAADFLRPIDLDFAVSSPLLRPRETAEAILEGRNDLSLTLEDQLKEIGHGLWEGKLESEIAAEFGDLLQQWKQTPEVVQMPEGENLQEVWDRSVDAWHSIVRQAPEGSTGLVVAHDAVNKVILCQVLGLQPKDIWAVKQGNGAVTVVDYPKGLRGKPVLQALNLTNHLGGVLDQTAAGAL